MAPSSIMTATCSEKRVKQRREAKDSGGGGGGLGEKRECFMSRLSTLAMNDVEGLDVVTSVYCDLCAVKNGVVKPYLCRRTS